MQPLSGTGHGLRLQRSPCTAAGGLRCLREALRGAERSAHALSAAPDVAAPPAPAPHRAAPRRRVRAAATTVNTPACVMFDLDSVACGLSEILTAVAFDAARAQWPSAIVGRAAAYAPTMRQLLTSVEAPEEAALLIRLCADEGIVGECRLCGWAEWKLHLAAARARAAAGVR